MSGPKPDSGDTDPSVPVIGEMTDVSDFAPTPSASQEPTEPTRRIYLSSSSTPAAEATVRGEIPEEIKALLRAPKPPRDPAGEATLKTPPALGPLPAPASEPPVKGEMTVRRRFGAEQRAARKKAEAERRALGLASHERPAVAPGEQSERGRINQAQRDARRRAGSHSKEERAAAAEVPGEMTERTRLSKEQREARKKAGAHSKAEKRAVAPDPGEVFFDEAPPAPAPAAARAEPVPELPRAEMTARRRAGAEQRAARKKAPGAGSKEVRAAHAPEESEDEKLSRSQREARKKAGAHSKAEKKAHVPDPADMTTRTRAGKEQREARKKKPTNSKQVRKAAEE